VSPLGCMPTRPAEPEPPPGSVSIKACAARLDRRRVDRALKRLLDVTVAVALLTVLAPALLGIAAGIKATSPGPVFFTQRRAGQGGRCFAMHKFRTMRTDQPPELVAAIAAAQASGDLVKLADDARVTPLGRVLRRASIDELPQLWNVLAGSMSLVGPRPLMPHMLEPYPGLAAARLLVRPGITGLWQVRDRAAATNARFMLPHDLEYITRFSFLLDLAILARTVPVVVSGRGAM